MLAIIGEGSMEMAAFGVSGSDDKLALEIYGLNPYTCQTRWHTLDEPLRKGEICRAGLILQDPYTYQLEIKNTSYIAHTIKPLIPYTAQIGINLTLDDPMRDTKIKARVLNWSLSGGSERGEADNLWDEAHPCYRFLTTHFAYDENGSFHGSVPHVGVDLSIPQGHWGGMDARNPALIETNVSDVGDGVLIVDKPFRSPEGTVAFWGLPLTEVGKMEVLLDCGDFQLGLIGGNGVQPFLRLKDKIIVGDEISRKAGLYSWRWQFTEIELKADFADAGGGLIPKTAWQESLPRWFNSKDYSAPFRSRITVLGAWQRMLTDDELSRLMRY